MRRLIGVFVVRLKPACRIIITLEYQFVDLMVQMKKSLQIACFVNDHFRFTVFARDRAT